MAHDVFISYSAGDKPTADAVCAALEAKGIRCWIAPRDILPGTVFSAAIIGAIHASRVLVLVFSSRSNDSPHVMREIERAVNKGLPIIPFRIEDVPLSPSMEYFISTPHWLDALTPPLQKHLGHLTETVRLLLSRAETQAAEGAAAGATPASGVTARPITSPALQEADVTVVGPLARRPAVRAAAGLGAVAVVLAVALVAATRLLSGSPPAPSPTVAGVLPPAQTPVAPTGEPTATTEPLPTSASTGAVDFGVITARLPAPDDEPTGLAWDGASLWLTSSTRIYRLDPTGQVLETYSPPDSAAEGLAWDESAFWIFTGNDDTIFRFLTRPSLSEPVRVLSSFRLSSPIIGSENHGLAWDGADLWLSNSYIVYQLDATGQILETLTFGSPITGLAWDGNQLWLAQDAWPDGSVISAADMDGNILFSAGSVPLWVEALAWGDGQLWAVGTDPDTFDTMIFRVDVSGAGP